MKKLNKSKAFNYFKTIRAFLKGSNARIIEKLRKVPGIGTRIEENKNTN